MVEANHGQRILFETVDENSNKSNTATISHVESNAIGNLIGINLSKTISSSYNQIPDDDNVAVSVLTDINPLLDDTTLYNKINAKMRIR